MLGFTPSVWSLCHTISSLSRQVQLYKALNQHLSDIQELSVAYWNSSQSAALSLPDRAGGKGPAEPLKEFLSQNGICLQNLTAPVCHRPFISPFPVTTYSTRPSGYSLSTCSCCVKIIFQKHCQNNELMQCNLLFKPRLTSKFDCTAQGLVQSSVTNL